VPTEPTASPRERLLAAAIRCIEEKGYAHTTTRDLVAASNTNLALIGYHFGGKEALLAKAMAECITRWTERVQHAVFDAQASGPQVQLQAALTALLDSFEADRGLITVCVETFPPALRSDILRRQVAAAYADARTAGLAMITRVCADAGLEPPPGAAAIPSLIIAICEGMMLQWLIDPGSAPDARQTLDALALLGTFLATDSPGSPEVQ
jgi:AcrR family transcriptional regulator